MKNKKNLIIIISVIVLVVLDQVFKLAMSYSETSVVLINNVLELTPIKNFGAAFSIGIDNLLMIILNLVIIVILIKFIKERKEEAESIITISLVLILSGGLSNFIDRLFRGYVVDYIDINKLFCFPIFNLADVLVVVGGVILGICILRYWLKRYEK